MIIKRNCCDHGDSINNQKDSIDYSGEWLYKVIESDKKSAHNTVAGKTAKSCRTPSGT